LFHQSRDEVIITILEFKLFSHSFRKEVERARSVAIVVVDGLRSVAEVEGKFSFPFIEADVRVAENLQGEPARIRRIKFQSNGCGGHTLGVGRYYVVLLHKNDSELKLG
jgi:hypothetical protein